MITARAGCRVDLAGGTLDIWPLGLLVPGARTVNFALDIPVEVHLGRLAGGFRVRQGPDVLEAGSIDDLLAHPEGALVGRVVESLDLPALEVEIESASPRGAGLGASSALAVALLAAGLALAGRPRRAPGSLASMARDIEARLMSLPTGTQDHYPALLGGCLEIRHEPGGEQVRRLAVDLAALGRSLVVAFTGASHFSAGQNWQIVRRRLDGEPEVAALLAAIAAVAAQLPAALERGDFQRAGELVGQEWSYRRHLAEGVSNTEIESLLQMARSLGAWGGKACGAGGGGCIVVLCPPERSAVIAEQLERAGGEIVAGKPSDRGLEIRDEGGSAGPSPRGS